MRVHSIIADIPVADIESAKDFYANYLGLSTDEFNMGWVARFTAPHNGTNLQLVTQDASAPENPIASIKVDDVEAALTEASERGYEIVHPLTTEPWGVRRFSSAHPMATSSISHNTEIDQGTMATRTQPRRPWR